MPQTSRYIELRRRIKELRRNLLPRTFSETGSYKKYQLDRARGFCMLVHAEIEAYFEEVCLNVALNSVSRWRDKRKVNDALFCLIAHYHHGFPIDESLEDMRYLPESRPKTKDAIVEIVSKAFGQFKKIKEDINGIKEKNLKLLLIPIGVRKDEIDSEWLANMSSFGSRRGDIAHKSAKVQQEIDPKSELQSVNTILDGIKVIDEKLEMILRNP